MQKLEFAKVTDELGIGVIGFGGRRRAVNVPEINQEAAFKVTLQKIWAIVEGPNTEVIKCS